MNDILLQRDSLRSEVITGFERLHALFPEWTRLWESDPRAEVFQSPAWALAWWRAFGHHCELCTVAVFARNEAGGSEKEEEKEELVGLVPLVRRDGVIQLLGTPEADYADIVCAEKWTAQVLAAAFAALRESVPAWTECVWEHLADESRIMRHFRSLPRELRAGVHCLATDCYHTILLSENRDAVFNSILGKKHTRRRINKLRKAGRVRFRELAAQHAVGADLDNFFNHHVRRHAAIGKTSCYADPEACEFVRTLFRELGPAARFGVLELNRRPLGWYFGFQSNGKFLLYQHTFDLEQSEFTPGELLLWNLFEYAQDHISRELDFGKGNEPYKTRFTNGSRKTFCLFLEPRGLRGRARGAARSLQTLVVPGLLQARHFAKSHRPTLRAFRSVRLLAQRIFGGSPAVQSRSTGSRVRLVERESRPAVLRRPVSDIPAAKTSAADDDAAFANAQSAGGGRRGLK